jgi:hypothetical protein
MKYRRAKRDRLRALTSEILPYEVPLPFDITRLYEFLRRLDFVWEGPHSFSVLDGRLDKSQKLWLGLVFDPIELGAGKLMGKTGDYARRRLFVLSDSGGGKSDLRHPYKFRSLRNNGKSRNLAVPHPHSMVQMASFVHDYRDSILYFTNRSNFSIRYPHRVARLQTKRDSVFGGIEDAESFGVEQSDLEYSHVSSYFSYRRYNNINRFYSSPEFQACERKYPRLVRADVAKCFDSVYTHTVSWVTNGTRASKNMQRETAETFGGKFDHLMQYLNYAETSGIIIGPELSRVFAEIILQEVDVRVERELEKKGLIRGTHYEVMRYVDDYFVFLADARKTQLVEEILSTQLAFFKLHLNDEKQHQFDTPLASHMSVAKVRMREALKRRTKCDFGSETEPLKVDLYFSSKQAILDYKALLIDTELKHGELANSYLYELGRRRDKTVRGYRNYLALLSEADDLRALHRAHVLLVRYLVEVLDVAIFVYSGAPSVSHGVKLNRMIAASIGELEVNGFSGLEIRQFRDRIRQEVLAQLTAVNDERSFGVHTLLLLDCLIYLDPEVTEATLLAILDRRGIRLEDLDAFGVLTLLRRFTEPHMNSDVKVRLLERAKSLIDRGKDHHEDQTQRAILLLSLPSFPGAWPKDIAGVMGDGYSTNKVSTLRSSTQAPSMFSWDASENYYERLLLKSAQFVY